MKDMFCRAMPLAGCLVLVATAGASPAETRPARGGKAGAVVATAAPAKVAPADNPTKAPARNKGPVLALSLADAVFVGLRKNTTIRGAYLNRIAQIFDLRVAEDVFTPHATVDGAVTRRYTAGVPTDSVSLGPSVQALTPVGTQFNFVWDNTASRTPGLNNSSSTLSASVVQPLLRGAGTDVNLAPVRAARLSEDINKLTLRATVSQTITDIVTAYRNLMAAQEAKKLADDAVLRAQNLIDIDQLLIQAGRIARVDVVQAQADLEAQKLGVIQAESQIDAARLQLAVLLDIDLATNIVIADKLDPKRASFALADALKTAFRLRPDYLIQLDAIEQTKLGITVADNNRLWDLSLVGNATIARSFQTVGLTRPGPTRVADGSFGLRLSVPVNDLTRDQTYLHATTSYQNADLQLLTIRRGIEQQIRLSTETIDLNWRQLDAARRVEALAANAVDIAKQKLSIGRSSNFEVATLEANYRSAQVQNLSAQITYLNSLTAFDLQLGTTLDTWKVSLAGQ